MFSKEESKRIRQEFWTSFGKEYPHKWLLYNTKMKEIQLKFTFNRKFAQVSLDVLDEDELIRAYYFEKLRSLEKVLRAEYLPGIIYDDAYVLPEGKIICRIYLQLDGVSVHDRETWDRVKEFLNAGMLKLEEFFKDFSDFLKH